MTELSPCYRCAMRKLGCHDRCQHYQNYRKKNEERRAAIQKEINNSSAYYEMTIGNSKAAKKRGLV